MGAVFGVGFCLVFVEIEVMEREAEGRGSCRAGARIFGLDMRH